MLLLRWMPGGVDAGLMALARILAVPLVEIVKIGVWRY
jgi:hypothetical protein